ncbi:hypothetical protein TcasGA2_TC011446 [Tribolium castaneum]|uniref:FLYWCH-type domain-containing protein n=1 Tax=Tribolium castaneum TaxID=7070 RepID=D6X4N6_TRICA|nr:hypothetical protein TcasGA2_TC011446 [Tribolium castaneum]
MKIKQDGAVVRSIYVVAATKNPKIIFDKNMFTICIKSLDKTRWRCTAYFKSKCRASLLTYGKYVNAKFKHNHPPTVRSNDFIENAMRQKVYILRRFIHFLQGRSYKHPLILLNGNEFFLHQKRANSTRWRCRAYHKTKLLLTFAKGSGRGTRMFPRLIVNDYIYIKHRSTQTITYWKCMYYDRGQCSARCSTDVNQTVRMSGIHSCKNIHRSANLIRGEIQTPHRSWSLQVNWSLHFMVSGDIGIIRCHANGKRHEMRHFNSCNEDTSGIICRREFFVTLLLCGAIDPEAGLGGCSAGRELRNLTKFAKRVGRKNRTPLAQKSIFAKLIRIIVQDVTLKLKLIIHFILHLS